MSVHYELNCGQYVMHRDGRPVTKPLDEVAMAIDVHGSLFKHGDPVHVQAWFNTTRASLAASGNTEMAQELVMLQGRFDVEELNKCISTSGYAALLYKAVLDGKARTLTLGGEVINQEFPVIH